MNRKYQSINKISSENLTFFPATILQNLSNNIRNNSSNLRTFPIILNSIEDNHCKPYSHCFLQHQNRSNTSVLGTTNFTDHLLNVLEDGVKKDRENTLKWIII